MLRIKNKVKRILYKILSMVHPCCGHPLQATCAYFSLFDMIWTFFRTIYHSNDLLTTIDSWITAGKIPHFGLVSLGILAYLIVLYAAYFAMSLILVFASHKLDYKKCNVWINMATVLVTIQILLFVVSLIVGHYINFVQEDVPEESIYNENDLEYRILKIPLQGISLLGSFYTVYELWTVCLFTEELRNEALRGSESVSI